MPTVPFVAVANDEFAIGIKFRLVTVRTHPLHIFMCT